MNVERSLYFIFLVTLIFPELINCEKHFYYRGKNKF